MDLGHRGSSDLTMQKDDKLVVAKQRPLTVLCLPPLPNGTAPGLATTHHFYSAPVQLVPPRPGVIESYCYTVMTLCLQPCFHLRLAMPMTLCLKGLGQGTDNRQHKHWQVLSCTVCYAALWVAFGTTGRVVSGETLRLSWTYSDMNYFVYIWCQQN